MNLSPEPFDHYIPRGPLNETPDGGYRPEHVRMEALKAILRGAELGEQDIAYLNWLAVLDDDTCRTIGSIMWRARLAGRAEVTSALEDLRAWIDGVLASEHKDRQLALESVASELERITKGGPLPKTPVMDEDQARAVDRARGVLNAAEAGREALAEYVGAGDGDSPAVYSALLSCLGRLVEVTDELSGGAR
jgi:hypothetical protein